MAEDQWLMRVRKGLSAHFKQPDGPSRPGVMWSVDLKRGEDTYTVSVKGLLTDDATPETRKNDQYQAQTAMQYLNDQLNSGWDPKQEKEHTIYIGNPLLPLPAQASTGSLSTAAANKPWWKIW